MVIAVVLGIPLGLWAGLRPDSIAGRLIMAGSILGFSLPTFFTGILFILLFILLPIIQQVLEQRQKYVQ